MLAFASNNKPTYAASARIVGSGEPFKHVTLGGQIFFASKGLLEEMTEASKKKHPDWEFITQEVDHA